MVWLRSDVSVGSATLDTVLFDVDGVLIDTSQSYRVAVIHATDWLVRVANGLTNAPDPLLTAEDVAAFKLAGGFNSDWDATQMLTALWTARLREWRGLPEAEIGLSTWAARASEAARERRGGLAWMHATFPATAIPSAETARWAEDEFYWGARLIQDHYGHIPVFAPTASGFVHNEELLLTDQLFPALGREGIVHLGLITGRGGPEVGWAVRRLVAGSGTDRPGAAAALPFGWYDAAYGASPFGVVITGDMFTKPDPRALEHAALAVQARGGVYVGDTADDLDLVLRYREDVLGANPQMPPFLAVLVASGPAADVYATRGADAVITHISDLPEALAQLRACMGS